MLEQILRYCNRLRAEDDFVRAIYSGEYTVEGGRVTPLFLAEGQYFYITGSLFSDGVHRFPAEGLPDETFIGQVWALALPRAFLDLVKDMEAWQEKNGKTADNPYVSESFGGWSGTKAETVTVWSKFKTRLAEWRKI